MRVRGLCPLGRTAGETAVAHEVATHRAPGGGGWPQTWVHRPARVAPRACGCVPVSPLPLLGPDDERPYPKAGAGRAQSGSGRPRRPLGDRSGSGVRERGRPGDRGRTQAGRPKVAPASGAGVAAPTTDARKAKSRARSNAGVRNRARPRRTPVRCSGSRARVPRVLRPARRRRRPARRRRSRARRRAARRRPPRATARLPAGVAGPPRRPKSCAASRAGTPTAPSRRSSARPRRLHAAASVTRFASCARSPRRIRGRRRCASSPGCAATASVLTRPRPTTSPRSRT